MRCADALEKASKKHPELLQPHKAALLGEVGAIDQQEVQWHVAQMLPRLSLNQAERHKAMKLLERYFQTSKSSIVRVNALQAIVELAGQDTSLSDVVNDYLRQALEAPAPSLQARARKLIKRL